MGNEKGKRRGNENDRKRVHRKDTLTSFVCTLHDYDIFYAYRHQNCYEILA